jgi:hypothetical protein
MNKNWILAILFVIRAVLDSQGQFSVIPDVGGVYGQAMSFLIVPDSDSIIILGHRYDTIIPGYDSSPWIGKFSYSGELTDVKQLEDNKYDFPFNVFSCPLAKKSDEIYYYYARIDTGGTYYLPYLIELNSRTGEVLKSRIIEYSNAPELPFLGTSIKYSNNFIYLLNYITNADSTWSVVTIVDTSFNLIKTIDVKGEINAQNFGGFLALNSDSTFEIVGITYMETGPFKDRFHLYFQKCDFNGHGIDYNLAPTDFPLTLGLAHTNTIIKDISGNWIISVLYNEDKSDSCLGCNQLIPYTIKLNNDFSQLIWQTRFYDMPSQLRPHYFLHSITEVEDGYITAGDFFHSFEGSPFPESGVLYKVSLNGDSLWMKHYIPLSWDSSRVNFVDFNDITTTNFNTIIVAGSIDDNIDNLVRPWILYLDADGCLTPECNTVNTFNELNTIERRFIIVVNPVLDNLMIECRSQNIEEVQVQIISLNGQIIRSTEIVGAFNYQYILPIGDISPGVYIVSISNKSFIESYKIIKQ